MKKLIFLIPFLASFCWADSVTTGNQGFLLPSTGVYDSSRNWGDKYNENWRIADSSMTTIQSQITSINTSTASIFNALYSTYTQLTSTPPISYAIKMGNNFNISYATQGYVWYDSSTYALNFKNAYTTPTLQIGLENWVMGWNGTGADIPNGTAVYVKSSSPSIGVVSLGLAKADAADTSKALGLTTMMIPKESIGTVTQFGDVNGLNTSQFNLGDRIFLSAEEAGVISSTNPVSPNFVVLLGYVKSIGTSSGTVFMTTLGNTGDLASGEASEITRLARKASAGTITKGQAVYIAGYNPGLGIITVELADADGSGTYPAIGLARETITNTVNGHVTIAGLLTGIDTSFASASNDPARLGTTAGGLQTARPAGLNDCVQTLGRVGRVHATNGTIQIIGAGRCNESPNDMKASTTSLATSLNGKINAGENNAGVVFSSMTTGLGGSSGASSTTISLTWNSDLYQSTGVGTNPAHYYSAVSTFNIGKAWAEVAIPSTYTHCSSTWTLQTSTGSTEGGRVIITPITGLPVFTMNYQLDRSTAIYIPTTPLKVNAFTHLYITQDSDPGVATCAGTPPRGEMGIKIWGYFDQ